jgi:hypothetical protein
MKAHFLFGLSLLLSSCGTLATEKSAGLDTPIEPFPFYAGTRSRVQVIQLGIPDDIVRKYPELAEKRVGWGMYERIIDTFYETGRFALIEEKADIQDRILKQWELSLSGLVINDQIPAEQGLAAPEYLVYAEVYEFSTSDAEAVLGLAAQKDRSTIVGIQLRLVRVADGSYVPASGMGEAATVSAGVWAPGLDFDQSTVGIATERAVHQAVASLLKRMD